MGAAATKIHNQIWMWSNGETDKKKNNMVVMHWPDRLCWCNGKWHIPV